MVVVNELWRCVLSIKPVSRGPALVSGVFLAVGRQLGRPPTILELLLGAMLALAAIKLVPEPRVVISVPDTAERGHAIT